MLTADRISEPYCRLTSVCPSGLYRLGLQPDITFFHTPADARGAAGVGFGKGRGHPCRMPKQFSV